ncbi:transketolase C-terminal domain-containing protein [Effusibacillus lacus]|uniref:Pyruvate synthase n=1 Tax=Effusibacillus lacus TaxID=1348429 RepID=A0A292YC27_9BACL|nr:transketolase C-terminal domain-containing protein [Effusibacillus lacus]TCS74426.1 pyruvate ferredoxin oxidoreductase alpha subunit [Effusibacillus lacus]GAX88702.1 pyruvate synthase [Effusibacillus lacus]
MALKETDLQEKTIPKTDVDIEQKTDFRSGNEMAAQAAAQINYHVMGYFPITPSTEIAEYLDEMKTEGKHDIVLIPADGEHGSAGICYGAATAGGRVFNATSANGFLYMIEQLPVQSGTRFPMVMNLVTRSVSGPLDIRGDHSDLYFGLNIGWPILLAKDPQAVYDMNLIALRVAEHKDVRLPVIVAYDGFFTSHQKRRVQYFSNRDAVQKFVGETPKGYVDSLDTSNPVTIGPYMNDPDYINNKYQQSEAMYNAERVYLEVAEEYAKISGRKYGLLDLYMMEDAEVAVFLLNSASDTAKDVVDKLRKQGIKAGVIAPEIIRPFPKKAIQEALKNVKVVLVGERADSFGGHGANLTHEVKAALQEIKADTTVLSRIYGLGGKDFYADDAEAFFQLCLDVLQGKEVKAFDYFGHTPGKAELVPQRVLKPLTKEETTGFVSVTKDEETGELKVKMPPLRGLTAKAKRIAPGHGACPGCGIFPGLETFYKGIEGDVVVLFHTGCAMVVTTGYPYSSHRITYIHNLFQNGAATLSGVVEMFWERKRRGEILVSDDITFIMITGDGGMDIGMGPAIGAALRNHKMIILEYDNEGYMNTGAQLSYSTPLGHMTATSNVGGFQSGKPFHHKDTAQIMAATNIPYVFTGTEAFPQDLIKKAAKAQWYAKNEGMAYGKILISCPLNWKAADEAGNAIVANAVNTCFFPLYEVEHGITKITYDPEEKGKRQPVSEWLKMLGKTKHLLKPENAHYLKMFEDEVERRWRRLKAKHENPYL